LLKTILIAITLAAATLAAPARAADAAPTSQQSRMAVCNKEAVGKKGDERKAFMKQCLSSKANANPNGNAKAKADGKPAASR
jgi:hypothetical protein